MKFLNLLRRQKSSAILGIDLNLSAVNIVELSWIDQKCRVENYISTEMPATIWQQKTIVNQEMLSTIIKSALKQAKITTRAAITAIPDTFAMCKIIQLNKSLSEIEIYDHIALQPEHYFSNAVTEFLWDFNILGISQNNPMQMDIELVAARKNEVERRMSILAGAGLNVKAVEIESFALARMANFLHLKDSTLLIHITDYFLLFGIFSGKNVMHVQERDEDFSTQDVNNIAEKMSKQLQLLMANDHCLLPEKILVSGNYHNILALQIGLENLTNIPVTICNPFSLMLNTDLMSENHSNPGTFMLSCGLAMWHFV